MFFNFFRAIFKIRLLEKMICSLTQGRSHKSFIAKFIPNNYQYKSNSLRLVQRNSINYQFDISDSVDWYLYFGLADKQIDEFYRYVKSDSIIFDIGTNVGSVLMNCALRAPKGYIYGFEPDTTNYNRCLRNLNLNQFKNIKIEKKGIGEKRQKTYLRISNTSNRGMNRITFEKGEADTEIEIDTIDLYTKENDIKDINLIKIDVEGFEYNVLKGAESTIRTFSPILFIELDDNNLKEQGASASDLVDFLTGLGYTIRIAATNKTITKNFNFINCHFDLLCIHPKSAL
jgi:FkbM family methyltransferase